jgi:iron complex outermembrane receptor protein
MKRISIQIAVMALSIRSAVAEPSVGDETIIIVDRAEGARDRDRALNDAPFVTVIHPDEHPATTSVADAVATSAGVHTSSLGGLGAYESISVRGNTPGHTAVLIDGVPVARIAAVTTDLGRFALDAFGEVDLYRGAVPVELGGAGVGGALDLITLLGPGPHGERIRASIGYGSFGARHLRVHYGDKHGRILSSTTIGYTGARGDYTYFDDNGTLLNPRDDGFKVRRNNGFDQLDLASRAGAIDRSLAGGVRVSYKQQGLPGSTAQPAATAAMSTLDVLADARGKTDVGAATAGGLGYVLVERQRLHDPDAELGLGTQDRGFLTLSGGASTTWATALGPHRGTAGLELRADHFRDEDLHGVQPVVTGDRIGGAAMLAIDLALAHDLVITPAFRIDLLRTDPAATTVGPDALMPIARRTDVVPSPRLTARFAVADDVSIKTSGGWYVRLPTLTELFGDHGFLLGDPTLLPERGPSGDFGLVWAPARAIGAIDRILVEADAFATQARDTIALITTAGFVARAENIGRTETYGGEVTVAARLARTLSITASYTRLETAQLSADVSVNGKPVPRSPAHQLYARADVEHRFAGRLASAWLDTSYQSTSFLDPASLGVVPARTLVDAGVSIALGGGTVLALAIENLADTRIANLPLDPPPSPTLTSTPTALTDVAGFPLPGRSFYLSLSWTH